MSDESKPLNPAALDSTPPRGLASYPPAEKWDDWRSTILPLARKVEKQYPIIPTICFNCEAGCGLLAYVDKQTRRDPQVRGQPAHPGKPRP